MNQQTKQLVIEGSNDPKTQAVINKIKALRRQSKGMWSEQEQQKAYDEHCRAIEQLEQLI